MPRENRNSPTILITNGIGDFIVYDSLCPDARLATIKRVYWANRGQADLIPVCRAMPAWQHVEHVEVFARWDLIRGFCDPQHVANFCARHKINLPPDLHAADSWTPHGWRARTVWRPSRLLDQPLADLSHLGLPERYVALQLASPHNVEAARRLRDCSPREWAVIDQRLGMLGLPGVLLDCEPGKRLAPSPRILDYRGKTTLAESFEIVKQAEGYIGTDSCLSVLASQIFDGSRLLVRTKNVGLQRDWWRDYYRPHTEPKWLVRSIAPYAFDRAGCFPRGMPVRVVPGAA